jgi:hypothetical protein
MEIEDGKYTGQIWLTPAANKASAIEELAGRATTSPRHAYSDRPTCTSGSSATQ